VLSYFFENIHLYLILKCLVALFGFALIDVLACDVLLITYPKEILILDASPFVGFI